MKLCKVKENGRRCGNARHCRGMCHKHYRRLRMHGSPHGGTPKAKLTEGQVRHIRSLWNFGMGWRQNALAKEFGVTPGTINKIVNGQIWKHINMKGGP